MLGSALTVKEACRGEETGKVSGKGSVNKKVSWVLLVTPVMGAGKPISFTWLSISGLDIDKETLKIQEKMGASFLNTVLLMLCGCGVGFPVALIMHSACVQPGYQHPHPCYNTHIYRASSPEIGSTNPIVIIVLLTLPKGATSALMLGPKMPHSYEWRGW